MASSSNQSFISSNHLRRRKDFRRLGRKKLRPTLVEPNDIHHHGDDYDDANQSSSFKLDFGKFVNMVMEKNNEYLDEVGGVEGITELLRTNREYGIQGDAKDLRHHRDAFGSNTYWRQNQQRKPLNQRFICYFLTTRRSLGIVVSALLLSLLVLIERKSEPPFISVHILHGIALCLAVNASLCLWVYQCYSHANTWEKKLMRANEEKTYFCCERWTPATDSVIGSGRW